LGETGGEDEATRASKRDVTWEFVIPLFAEAADVAKAAIGESAACSAVDGPHFLFPGFGSSKKPISDNTLSKLHRDAGLKGLHVPHGWRSGFSTLMSERAAIDDSRARPRHY
jgi:integrase